MSDWWVREHWGRAFEIVTVAPEIHGQTWMLLRARDVDPRLAELERPSDDRREYVALKHNVLQVERDRERALGELRHQYEHSLSWRITRPLRTVARLVRRSSASSASSPL
jgi:hypothetical protein